MVCTKRRAGLPIVCTRERTYIQHCILFSVAHYMHAWVKLCLSAIAVSARRQKPAQPPTRILSRHSYRLRAAEDRCRGNDGWADEEGTGWCMLHVSRAALSTVWLYKCNRNRHLPHPRLRPKTKTTPLARFPQASHKTIIQNPATSRSSAHSLQSWS